MDEAVAAIIHGLRAKMETLPEGFFGTFRFTRTGNNWAHPVTLGLLNKIIGEMALIEHVAIDARLNRSGVKFQPDLTCFRWQGDIPKPLIFVDYESPNSSDARIITKDIDAYLGWIAGEADPAPYIIVTTLPSETIDWKLRYTAEGKYNHGH